VLDPAALPAGPIAVLGPTGSKRIDTLVHDMVEASEQAGDIVQGEEGGAAMDALRTFMFDEVYLGPVARAEHEKINTVIGALFEHYVESPELLPEGVAGDLAQRVTDYIAGMTDRFCLRTYEALTVPRTFAL
jgi:dGTPase